MREGLERMLGRRRLRRARRLAAGPARELSELCAAGLVAVTAEGLSIERIRVCVANRTDLPLRVAMPHGTCFRARGDHQGVVLRREVRLDLASRAVVQLRLPYFGLEPFRRTPAEGDPFRRVVRAPQLLRAFLSQAGGLHAAAVQAGVWALTEGCTRSAIRGRMVCEDGHGRRGAALRHEDLDAAQALLDRLGIAHHLSPTREDQLDRIGELVRQRQRADEAAGWALHVAALDFGRSGLLHPESIESRGLAVRVLAWARRLEEAIAAGAVLEQALLASWSDMHPKAANYLAGAALDLLALQVAARDHDTRVLRTVESWLRAAVAVLAEVGEAAGGAAQVYEEGVRQARRLRVGRRSSGAARRAPG